MDFRRRMLRMIRYLAIRNLAVIDRLEVEFEPGFNVLTGETGAGKSILVEAVGLLARRPRVGRPRPDRRGARRRSKRSSRRRTADELIVRREIYGAGPQPRVRQRRAGDRGGAQGSVAARSSSCTASTSIRSCSTRRTHLDRARRVRRPRRRARQASRRRSRRGSDARERARPPAHGRPRESAARSSSSTFQLGEIEKAALEPGEDEELAATRQVLAQRRHAAAALRRELRGALRRRRGGARRRSAASGSGSASWRRSIARFAPLPRRARRRSSRSSRTSRSSCATTPTASMRRRRGCRRSRTGWRCSSV